MAYITEQFFYDTVPEGRILLKTADRPVYGWGAVASSIYPAFGTGIVTVLKQAGADLGDPQANLAAVTEEGEWFWDSDTDKLSLYTATDPNTQQIMAGEDHATYVTRRLAEATNVIDGLITAQYQTPIPVDKSGEYGAVLKLITAYQLAVMQSAGKEEINLRYQDKLMNVDETGLIDQILAGKIKFNFEIDADSSQGSISVVSVSGGINLIETRGIATGIRWDAIKVIVVLGGSIGTATYSVFTMDGETLKSNETVTEEVIDGDFQPLAYGLQIRFRGDSGDEATANDEWEVEVRGDGESVTNPGFRTMQASRY